MQRRLWEPQSADTGEEKPDRGMGLAPVFAAALGAACCLAVPLLVGLLGGSATGLLSGEAPGLLTLVIIGFALGGVLAVAISYWRGSKRRTTSGSAESSG